MELPDARTLSPEAQQALRERVVHAVQAEGLRMAAAARAFGVNRSTARGWVNAFRRTGADAWAAQPRGRKPHPLLTADQEAQRLGVLTDHTPDPVGRGETRWTRDAVAAWAARERGARRSRWVGGRWRLAHDFTPPKPARRAYERDPAAVERWRAQEYPRIEAEAKAEGAEIHWRDEAGVRSAGQAGRGYAPRGQTPVQPVPGKRCGVNYLATGTNLGVLRCMVFGGRFTAAVLRVFRARRLLGRPGKV
jgi:transposase